MRSVKEKLAYTFLELLESYEIGNPKKYDDLLTYMEYCESANPDAKHLEFIWYNNIL